MEPSELGRQGVQIDRNREDIVDLRIEQALILERVARSLTPEDSAKLEERIMAAVDEKLDHICDHITKDLNARDERLIAAFETSNRRQAARLARRNDRARDRIIRYGFIFGGLMLTALTALTSGGGQAIGQWLLKAGTTIP